MILQYLFYAYLLVISVFALISTCLAIPRYKDYKFRAKRHPKTLVIVPCKGVDYKMDENLTSFKLQGYRNYDIIAVIDNSDDTAVQHLKAIGLKYIIADKRPTKGSGKVNAIATAIKKFRKYEIYVIADSDILVKDNWLSELVAPFSDERTGLSTSYPYFRAEAGFWSRVKMVWVVLSRLEIKCLAKKSLIISEIHYPMMSQ
jgi:cellulose synthase/poly-beta-1,6-N-acetylglucosamine synthase-like glycosyltransferase